MKKMIALIQAIAAFCALLVFSIPVTSAMNIRVFMPGGTQPAQEFAYDIASKVKKSLEITHDSNDVRWENVWVKMSVVGKDQDYEIKKIYLFICKDKDPAACASVVPIEAGNSLSGERASFKWSADISNKGIANFMTLVKMSHNGKAVWVGFFDTVERTAPADFNILERNLDSVDIYAKGAVNSEWIKNYVEEYEMAPVEWTERAVVSGSSSFYTVTANSTGLDGANLASSSTAGTQASVFVNDYTIIFGKDITQYPFTFFNAPVVSCGDKQCDLNLGETTANCCLDCGCPLPSQDCTANADYPNGLCHVCGDGTRDAVENITNCCADMGCTDGKYCDSTIRPPYGMCVNASCGQKGCEGTEDSINCARDCHATPGKTCPDVYGDPTYYYSESLRDCTQASCGNEICEGLGGETADNCCIDCNACPSGQYCNTTISQNPNGVCMSASCTQNGCEPGEEYKGVNACCTDCSDCPAGMVCESNVCHTCGNGKLELPAETPATCCQDTGCPVAGSYCTESGACMAISDMEINVMLSPSAGADCNQQADPATPITAIISIRNMPKKFGDFTSASYSLTGGSRKTLACARNSEDSTYYQCEIPLSGEGIFPGCFEKGPKDVNITTSFTYYENVTKKTKASASVSKVVVIDVTNPRPTSCDMDYNEKGGGCEAADNEGQSSCCYDCGCPSGDVCAGNVCILPSSLAITAEDVSGTVDCSDGTKKVSFSAYMPVIPDSGKEPFGFAAASQMLDYCYTNGGTQACNTASTTNLTGFSCTFDVNGIGEQTGRVSCAIPVSVFPLCPYGSGLGNQQSASMGFSIGVKGGGIGKNGMRVSDKAFGVTYLQGLPNCNGLGVCNDVEGENEATCCRDCGCADSATVCEDATEALPCAVSGYAKRFCSVDAGACDDEMNIGLELSMEGGTLDCTDPEGLATFKVTVTPGPMEMDEDLPLDDVKMHTVNATGNIDYGYHYIDYDSDCTPLNSQEYECQVDTASFNPCWDTGEKKATLSATINYAGSDGETRSIDRASPEYSFTVSNSTERDCDHNGKCDWGTGELPGSCCTDCGCSEDGMVCAREGGSEDYGCEEKSGVKMTITSASEQVSCSDYDSNTFELKFRIDNVPYNTKLIDWTLYMDKDGDGKNEAYKDVLDCEDGGGDYKNVYECTADTDDFAELCYYQCNVQKAGGCPEVIPDQKRKVIVNGTIYHFAATADDGKKIGDINVTSSFDIIATDLLPSCSRFEGGSPTCDEDYGENTDNCCTDCKCTGDAVCTVNGCRDVSDITMTLTPDPKKLRCSNYANVYDSTGSGKNIFKISLYECKFVYEEDYGAEYNFEFDANFNNMPAEISGKPTIYYKLVENGKVEKKSHKDIAIKKEAGKWKIYWSPLSVTGVDKNADYEKIEVHVEVLDKDGNLYDLKDTVALDIEELYSDDLTSIEGNLGLLEKNLRWLKGLLAVIAVPAGICAGCLDLKSPKSIKTLVVELVALAIIAGGIPMLYGFKGDLALNLVATVLAAYAGGVVIGVILNIIPWTKANICAPMKNIGCIAIGTAVDGISIILSIAFSIKMRNIRNLMNNYESIAQSKPNENIGDEYNEGITE